VSLRYLCERRIEYEVTISIRYDTHA
jgi:hypothetical protein